MLETAAPRISVFKPLPWQIPAWKDKTFTQLLTGSAGGGKSRLAAEKLHGYLLKYPGANGVMLRKTRESVLNSIVLFYQGLIVGNDPRVKWKPTYNRFEYQNGSMLMYGGMKNKDQREQIRSFGLEGGLDIVWMEEATSFVEDDFNELLARMRGTAAPWQQIILTTNPDQPQHWIYKRLIQAGEAAVYYSKALDNTHNPSQYIDILNRMTGVLYDRLVLGRWVQAEGAVYSTFSDEIHVLNDLPDDPPMYYKRFIGAQDWGYTNPGVFQVWGIDSDGRMTLVEEIYKSRELIGWWKKRVKERCDHYGVEVVMCDPAEPAYIEEFSAEGIPAMAANNEIGPGIQRVQRRLKVADDGRPRLYVYRGACAEIDPALETSKKPTSTLAEFPAYVWAKGADGKPNKEIPVDDANHGLDCTRYATNYLDANEGDWSIW